MPRAFSLLVAMLSHSVAVATHELFATRLIAENEEITSLSHKQFDYLNANDTL